MAKTMSTVDTAPSSTNGTKKQRKKQAKREAKTMLRLEQSRKDVQKAEQKVARAQAQLEARRTRLHNLEAEVEKMQKDESNSSGSAVNDGNTSQEQETAPTNEPVSLPPSEGRTDIPQDQETSSDQAANNGDASQEQESSVSSETETTWHPIETWEQDVQAEEVPHDGAEAEGIHEGTEQ